MVRLSWEKNAQSCFECCTASFSCSPPTIVITAPQLKPSVQTAFYLAVRQFILLISEVLSLNPIPLFFFENSTKQWEMVGGWSPLYQFSFPPHSHDIYRKYILCIILFANKILQQSFFPVCFTVSSKLPRLFGNHEEFHSGKCPYNLCLLFLDNRARRFLPPVPGTKTILWHVSFSLFTWWRYCLILPSFLVTTQRAFPDWRQKKVAVWYTFLSLL